LVDLVARVVDRRRGRFPDSSYREAGAEIVFRREEVYRRCEVIVGVSAPTMEEITLTSEGQILMAFWHLAVAPKALVSEMNSRRLTAIGYEVIERDKDRHPVLNAMSELAGQMAIHTAAHLLQRESGGRGILLGACPGIPPATILVIGAGTAGRAAIEAGIGTGAHVIVLDDEIEKLRFITREYGGRVVTATADRENLARFVQIADVVIGAVLVQWGHAPTQHEGHGMTMERVR
jgi:alanine dehydrogenase